MSIAQSVAGSVASSLASSVVGSSGTTDPRFTTQPTDATVNVGEDAVFFVVAEGTEPLEYQCQKNGVDIPGATSATYTKTSVVSGDNGNSYRFRVTNANGVSIYSNSATLTVNAADPGNPVITDQPDDATVSVGDNAVFVVAATGTGTLTYQWRKNIEGTPTSIGGETSDTLTISSVSLLDSGNIYDVVVTDDNGSVTSNSATLTVPSPIDSLVKFGTLTPAGEGEQSIDAANGTYSVGGGSFSVASNRINVVTMPAAGTYSVDGVDVQVVTAARTCSTAAELAVMWKASNGTHPVGTRILIPNGSYNVYALLSGSTYLRNDWIWESIDSANRATFTSSASAQYSYEPSSSSPGCKFLNVNFYREQDAVGIPWNIIARDVFTVRNSIKNMRFDGCRFYGNFTASKLKGKLTTKLTGLSCESNTGVSVTNCEFDHLCTIVRLGGEIQFEGNTLHDSYSDFFELRTGVNGEIINNHCYNKIGDGTFLHGDFFQLQVPPSTPASGPLLIEGNTCSDGEFWDLASGQANGVKPDPTINTAGPNSLSSIATYHGADRIYCRVADAGGTMALTFPPATGNEFFTIVLYQVGAGTITVTLDGSDTADDSLTMTSNNQSRSYVSDGAGHWRKVAPGYRGSLQQRTASQTLGNFEKDLAVFADAEAGAIDLTLPSGTGAYNVSIKKDDTSVNLVSIKLPGGQTFTDHGVPGVTSDMTIDRCGDVMEFDRAEGASIWVVTEKTTTSQGIFSNGASAGWDGLVVRHNILFVNSPNGFRIDDDTNLGAGFFRSGSKVHNNTFLRATPPDANGDGVIGPSDSWNSGTVGSVYVFDGVDTFRNAFTGTLIDNGPALRKLENQTFGWSDPEDLSALNVYLAANDPTDLRPTTRDEVVASALAKSAGPLVIDAGTNSYIGAVGTSATNGPYNWTTGVANTNTKAPAVASMLPVDGATDVGTNTTIRITFDELITLGTGNVSIRAVGGAEIEAFDVASSGQLVVGDNGVTLIITPTSDLPATTDVCIRIASTAIDGYFNSFAGITDDSLNFTTAAGAVDPEMLPDPTFDTPSEWYGGASPPGTFPSSGWTVSGGLASKDTGSNFQALSAAEEPAAVAGTQYIGSAKLDSKTIDTGNLRIQLVFLDSGGSTLESTNTNTPLSGLSVGSSATHTRTAPTGTAKVRLQIVATSGAAVFTLSDASLQVL